MDGPFSRSGREGDGQPRTEGKGAEPGAVTGPRGVARALQPGVEATAPTAPATASPVSGRSGRQTPRRSFLWRWTRRLILAALLVVGVLLGQIIVYRFVDPPVTPILLARQLMGEPVDRIWVPLNRVTPALVRGVIVSEDARFCTHHGIDFGELRAAIDEARKGQSPRGASTISMQLVKNLLLWPDRSYIRKAVELPLTVALEAVWPKWRIMEVYLNLAEWGPGIYGIEAASRATFSKSAADLTFDEAARLAVVLPNPADRDAADPDGHTERLAGVIAGRMRGSVNTACVSVPRQRTR